MARPIDADAAATKRSIFEQACQLFAAKGLRATSMREIAWAASVSQASVHHYFGTKQELYEAAVDEMYKRLRELRREIEERAVGSDWPTVIGIAVRSAFRFALAHRSTALLVTREVLDHGEASAPQRTEALEPFLDDGSRLLAAATGRDPAAVRLALLSSHFLVIRYALMSPSDMARSVTARRSTRKSYDDKTLALVESHLVEAAMRLLWIRP